MITAKDVADWFRFLQTDICKQLEKADGKGKFKEDPWERTGGGGGLTRILAEGNVIEKGGVNFSEVFGEAPSFLKNNYKTSDREPANFFATGVSIVIHPKSPEVPIIHMNVRYFEMGNHKWFGGGIDLTPHYIVKDDARYFHGELKKMCDRHDQNFYPLYKKDADNYFFIPHRNETRGIGGIFFDRLEATSEKSLEQIFDFVKSTGTLFAPVYCELIERNRNKSFDESGKQWQRLRRGRYVEFNLVYDKGTKFGLETNGRTESILMSLPPEASWTYDFKVKPGSREEETQSLLKKGIDWI